MKLGFLTACLPHLRLEEIAAWAAEHRFEALEVAAWPTWATARSPPPTSMWPTSPTGTPKGSVSCSTGTADPVVAGLLRQQPPPRPDRAQGRQRPRAGLHRRRRPSAARPSGPSSAATPASRWPTTSRRPRRSSSPGRPGRRAGREADHRELRDGGLAPRRLPRQPGVFAGAVGVDVLPGPVPELRPLAPGLDGDRPGDRPAALCRPDPPCPGQGHPAVPDRRNRFGWPGRAVERPDPWDVGWWRYRVPGLGQVDWRGVVDTLYEGGFTGCCRSSTRTRCGAAPRTRSRPGWTSPITPCGRCWWPDVEQRP